MENRPIIKADTLHVDELVSRALRGRIRLPRFQRGLKWRATDVQQLFDSIHRGFPIGTLLMWKRPAGAEPVSFGPVTIDVSSTDDAWWVVDGQQRLTSLVAGLKHPDPSDPDDPFVVYYDMKPPTDQPAFFRPHRLRPVTKYCIPLRRCLDAADFQEWLFEFVEKTGERGLIEQASALATRIRDYRVPVYLVETDDAEVARQIFIRTNRAGRRMVLHEVFAALVPAGIPADRRPEAIASRLTEAFGPVDPNVVAKTAKSLVSDDVTRTDELPDVPDHEAWMVQTESVLEVALSFLVECGVPHTRLLPAGPTPLVTLGRFFAKHPSPSDRSRRLLRRWLWRGFFSDGLSSDARTLRRAVVAVDDDEDASIQRLLAQVPKQSSYDIPADFDARHGMARLAVLILALQQPVAPVDPNLALFGVSDEEDSGDVFSWLQSHGAHAFSQLPDTPNDAALRFVTPGVTPASLRDQLRTWAAADLNHAALRSHLVSPEAAQALLDDRMVDFATERREALRQAADEVHRARAEPDKDDRPPLLVAAGP